jgi:2-keto-4-pentenoate hydratase/2-oxohepta-3-ene-1,7-dioic acid hydratase in catechol pathway
MGEAAFADSPEWPAPTKGIGMMRNFKPPAGQPQQQPAFFVRSAGSISSHGVPIKIPKAHDTILYEGELVIVIGKRASRATPQEAEACILGFTCGMDGSPDDPAGSFAGKSTDGIAPIGPRLIPRLRDEGHAITLRVNGEVVERAHTSNLVWGPGRIVSEISQTVTLQPGDVVFCGATRAVPKMKPGDVVEVEIEGIGVLSNRVEAED